MIPRRRRRSTPTAVGGRRRIRTGPVMLWGSARSFRRRRRGVIGMESERGRRARVVVGNLVGPVSRRFSLGEHTLATQVTWTDMICVLVLVGARPAVLCPVLPRSGADQGRPLTVATLRLVARCSIIPADSARRGQGRMKRSDDVSLPADDQRSVRDFERGRTHDGHDRMASSSSFVCACLACVCSFREGKDQASRDAQNEAIERTRFSFRLGASPSRAAGFCSVVG